MQPPQIDEHAANHAAGGEHHSTRGDRLDRQAAPLERSSSGAPVRCALRCRAAANPSGRAVAAPRTATVIRSSSQTRVSQPAVSQSAVAWRSQASRSRTTGSAGPAYSSGRRRGQSGGCGVPASAHAACRAAPSATYSSGAGTRTWDPEDARGQAARGLGAGPAADQQDPVAGRACAAIRSAASASVPSTASIAARARLAAVAFCVVRPRSTPVASGRFGVRSPSR